MTVALACSNYVDTFQFSAGHRELTQGQRCCLNFWRQTVPFHANELTTESFLSVVQPGHLDLSNANGIV